MYSKLVSCSKTKGENMKVVFLQKDSFVKIGIMLLCAVLKEKGHAVDIIVESGESKFIEAALNSKADLFGFSCTTGGEDWVLEVAEKLKKHGETPVLIGGPHVTFFPEFIKNKNIDWLCRGEGEQAIVELVEALESNPADAHKVANICSLTDTGTIHQNDVRNFVENLDDLPFPDFTPYTKYHYLVSYNMDMYPVMIGRGCPYNCSYCFNKNYKEIYHGKGKYLRKRSPQNVIIELLHAKIFFGVKKINFVDDSFFSHPEWLKEFAPLYIKEIGLPFIINLEVTQVRDDLVSLIKDMGCLCVRMGVETGSEYLRHNVLKKKVTDNHIRQAAALIKQHKIALSTFNILGLPGESIDQALETYTLNREIGSDLIQCSLLQPYPGTDLNSYVKEKGFYDNSNDEVLGESYFVATKIKLENKKEIMNLQKLMQIMSQINAPKKLVLFFIAFPENPIFSFLFKISFIYGKIKVQKIKIIPLIRLGLHSLGYMKVKH